MAQNRRSFLKSAGTACTFAMMGGFKKAASAPKPAGNQTRGVARGLTLLTMRRDGEYRLGVKTDKGILDTGEAAKVLHMSAPATMDDLLQNEDGPSLNALVDAASRSKSAQKAYIKEECIECGPVVTRPEKLSAWA